MLHHTLVGSRVDQETTTDRLRDRKAGRDESFFMLLGYSAIVRSVIITGP